MLRKEIAQAIEQFNTYQMVDVMIVGRGGGSFEDLWPFNEEVVAEAIYHSRIPIISAVGHEIDHCIADYVADVRAPTPSAAAEIVIAEKAQQLHHLAQVRQRMQHTLKQLIRQDRHRLNGILRHPLLQTPYGILGPWIQHLDHLRQACDKSMQMHLSRMRLILQAHKLLLSSMQPAQRLKLYREKLRGFKQIFKVIEGSIANKRERFNLIAESLHAVNPKNLLTKGYCILFFGKNRFLYNYYTATKTRGTGTDLAFRWTGSRNHKGYRFAWIHNQRGVKKRASFLLRKPLHAWKKFWNA